MNQSTSLTYHPGALRAQQLDYVLLDLSASMHDKWWNVIGSLDAFVATAVEQGVNSHAILHTFTGGAADTVQEDCPLREWPKLGDFMKPGYGDTPLYDAIAHMAWRLRDLQPARCAITIVTDGEEMGSQFTTADQAKALIDWCKAMGWSVTFIGAGFNVSKLATRLGLSDDNNASVQTGKLLEAGKALGQKRADNARYGKDISFSKEEKSDFGGFLTGPSESR